MRIRVGGGVKEGGIATEGAQDVDGGLMVVEEVHLGAAAGGVPDEQDQVVASLEEVGAGLDRGLSRRLYALWGEDGWGGAQCRIGRLPGGRS